MIIMKKNLRNASREGLNIIDELAAYMVATLVNYSPAARRRIKVAGSVADYFQKLSPYSPITIYGSREQLWKYILRTEFSSEDVDNFGIYEFGVAWGYLTEWWTMRLKNKKYTWHGFDRFTGLPRAWEDSPEGAFSANGSIPPLNNPQIVWHVGNVEDKLPDLKLEVESSHSKRIIFFDLDIYEPTKAAYNYLKSTLKPGDILYFDEARMDDEWKLLEEEILQDFDFFFLGATFNCLAIKIKSIRT